MKVTITIFTIISLISLLFSVGLFGYVIGRQGKKEVQQILDAERQSAFHCQDIKGRLEWDGELGRVFCLVNP